MNFSEMPRWQRILLGFLIVFMLVLDGYLLILGLVGTENRSAGTTQELVERLDKEPTAKVRIIVFEDKTVGLNVYKDAGSAPVTWFVPEQFFDPVREKITAKQIPVESAGPNDIERRVRGFKWMHVLGLLVNLYFLNLYFGGAVRSWLGRHFADYQPAYSERRFDDVAGIGEAKAQLQQLVEMLKHPERFEAAGAGIPRGYLFVGPPGTGKTLLAEAVAGEAGVPFFAVSGSEFVYMYVGVGAHRVRQLFKAARAQNQPVVIFIDELDAVGRARSNGSDNTNDEREATLNQILVEMQGFHDHEFPIIVLAATNRPQILDDALTRPGRLDRTIHVRLPNAKERKEILEVTVKGREIDLAADVDLDILARSMPGKSGADMAEVVNRATIRAAAEGRTQVTMDDLSEARDQLLMGSAGTVIVFDPLRESVSHHEAGHAVVAFDLSRGREDAPEVHSVSVLQNAVSLGRVMYLPKGDDEPIDAAFLRSWLAILLGGRAGEMVLGQKDSQESTMLCSLKATAGVDNDLKRAFDLAFKMVARWGMSKKLGATVHVDGESDSAAALPESVRTDVFAEIKVLLEEAADMAKRSIERQRKFYDLLVVRLKEKNVVRFQDLKDLATEAMAA